MGAFSVSQCAAECGVFRVVQGYCSNVILKSMKQIRCDIIQMANKFSKQELDAWYCRIGAQEQFSINIVRLVGGRLRERYIAAKEILPCSIFAPALFFQRIALIAPRWLGDPMLFFYETVRYILRRIRYRNVMRKKDYTCYKSHVAIWR